MVTEQPWADTAAPLSDLPPDVCEYLQAAMQKIRRQAEDGYEGAWLVERARADAKEATLASNQEPSNQARIESLSQANARVAAATSLGVKAFPAAVSPDALIAVANLSVSLGRTRQVSGDLDGALGLYMLALDLVRVYRAYARTAAVDQITYGVASRAAAAAGELAAERQLSLERTLDVLDRNIVHPYSALMTSEELSAPRGFGVVAMLGRALVLGDQEYLKQLRAQLDGLQESLVPVTPAARMRFESDMAALLSEVDVRLGKRQRGTFEW